METYIISPENEAQQRALQSFLETAHIPYEHETYSDETDFLTSTEANKKRLDAALEAVKRGEGVKMNLNDIC